ncbi:MAG: MgtC/SapB family protein [Acidimicrobiia bacterium]|nr:MgtC/SapB family protein [Acidimicrobiia bacterium]NNL28936.1 MgtC/SapB family protein [Acidimicrobiia bacterium]
MPGDVTVLEWSLRLILAALFSGIVGFEREAQHKAAGLRTHMLVGFGAALFTLVGGYAFEGADPSRVAAQVVTGVGFLGAGAIFRQGVNVRGLTTAAGLWAVAAIGMTAGVGIISGAAVATAITFVILNFLGFIETIMRKRGAISNRRPFSVKLSNLTEFNQILNLIRSIDDQTGDVGLERIDDETYTLGFDVDESHMHTLVAAIKSFDSVVEASEIDPPAQ